MKCWANTSKKQYYEHKKTHLFVHKSSYGLPFFVAQKFPEFPVSIHLVEVIHYGFVSITAHRVVDDLGTFLLGKSNKTEQRTCNYDSAELADQWRSELQTVLQLITMFRQQKQNTATKMINKATILLNILHLMALSRML